MSDPNAIYDQAYAEGLHLGRVEARQVERILTMLITELRGEHPWRDGDYCDRCVDEWHGNLSFPCPSVLAIDRAEKRLADG